MRSGRAIVSNLVMILCLASAALIGAGVPLGSGASHADGPPPDNGVTVGHALRVDLSPPLRTMTPMALPSKSKKQDHDTPPLHISGHINRPDPVVQRSFGPNLSGSSTVPASAPSTMSNWEGISIATGKCGCAPPDSNGAVGATINGTGYYVQTVNVALQIWNKNGTSLLGPENINTLWSATTGACQSRNDGDPIVLYDRQSNRFIISQLTSSSPYDECIAVSRTGDPTGQWYLYTFQMSTTLLQDYPKLAVWPDGYYMTTNEFQCTSSFFGICLSWSFQGPKAYVFDRSTMLGGGAATFQAAPSPGSSHNAMLPSNLDGTSPPPSGAPNYIIEDGGPSSTGSSLSLWKFHVDWATPALTTFANTSSIATAGWTQLCASTQDCVAQPSPSTQKLDGLGDRLMYRLAYRNLGDHEALVVTHTVDAGGGQAGVRWYEIRNPGSSPSMDQQGTYAPSDGNSRWLGSAAMDKNGDLAIGYSLGGASTYPSIAYTGRLASDPANQLPQGETVLQGGGGYQNGTNRWGDYSSLQIDPTDDCTFWYTNEYYSASTTNTQNWQTRIGSFAFPACGSSTTLSVTASSTSPTAGSPTSVTVTAKDASGNTLTSYTGTVHLTSTDPQATFSPATYTFATADNGTHVFSATLKTAGNQTITATDASNTAITGNATVTVNPATATSLMVAAPASATAGTAATVTVTAKDPYSNTATGYAGTVRFTSGDSQAALPSNYTFTSSDNGAHAFTLTFHSVGSYAVTATDTVATSIAGSSGGVSVVAGVPDVPSSVTATAGTKSAVVTWTEGYNNANGCPSFTVTTYSGTSSNVVTTTNVAAATTCTPGQKYSVNVSQLRTGKSYSFAVRAGNSAGTSASSIRSNVITAL